MSKSNTLALAFRDEIYELLAPLIAAAQQPAGVQFLLQSVGRTDELSNRPDLRAEIERLAALAQNLAGLEADTLASWAGLTKVLDLSRDLLTALCGLERVVSDPTLAEQGRDLGLDLVQHLVALDLRVRHPGIFRAASLLTLITPAELAVPLPMILAGPTVLCVPRRADEFHPERVEDLLQRPLPTLSAHYFPNGLAAAADAHEAARRLFPILGLLAQAFALPSFSEVIRAIPETESQPTEGDDSGLQLDHFGGAASGIEDNSTDEPPREPVDLTTYFETFLPRFVFVLPGLELDDAPTPPRFAVAALASSPKHPGGASGLVIAPLGELRWSEVRGDWRLSLESNGQVPAFVLGPGGVRSAATDSPLTAATARFLIERIADAGVPAFVVGAANGTRLEIGALQFSIDVRVAPGESSTALALDARLGAFVLAPGDADGFLSSFLPKDGLHTQFDLGLTLSSDRGFVLRGAAGLDATLPVGLSLGGVSVPTLSLGLHASDAGLQAEVSVNLGLSIGPVLAVVDRVGLTTAVTFPKEGGNLGVVDLALRFKHPSGAGITVDSPFVTGGGFFSFDEDKGQYAGVVQLNIEGGLTVTALGLIATRLPNGDKGFSFLVLITAEDFQPIPLGLGFTLAGIGGLLAINRTCNEEVLREGIKNQTLSTLFFPHDPIRNAPQIFSSLNAVFPPQNGSYLFGPVVRINWGTPPVLTMDLGVVLEVGQHTRLLILGRVSAILPSEQHDLIRLQMNTVGIIDFDQQSVSLDAVLYDSRLLGKFPLTGSMAMRLHWGSSPVFALSIGGFHPAFKPPTNFPTLERITISLCDSENFRLRAESYLAITANTVQFGAHAELYARAGGFSIEGLYGYDVLIQFDPFAFVADFAAAVQLKHGSTNLFSVKVEGELAVPRPLHIKGKATFAIFWCDFSVGFDQTLLDGEPPPLPEAVNILEKVKAALDDARNWGGQLADGERRLVSVRNNQEPNTIALHPLGTLSVKQSVVPLELEIAKFGQARPADAHLFAITSVSVNGKNIGFDHVSDFFAPASFLDLTDDEKLAAPSFEPMTAGVSVHAGGFIFPTNDADLIEDNALRYEPIPLGKKKPPLKPPPVTVNSAHLDTQIALGAAARSAVRRTGTAKYRPAGGKNALGRGGWVIVSAADQSHQAAPGIEAGKSVSYAQALQAVRTLKQENPARAKGLMILRGSEVVN